MAKAKINGQEYSLAFTLDAWDAMEAISDELTAPEDAGKGLDLKELMNHVMSRKVLCRMLAILISAAAALEDRTPGPEADAKWIARHVRPGQIRDLGMAVIEAITEGMRMETEEEDPNEEVDVVLEEIKKNDSPGE